MIASPTRYINISSTLIVRSDATATATANNIAAHETLFLWAWPAQSPFTRTRSMMEEWKKE